MANIEEKVEEKLKPIIEEIGYKLYDVEYAKEAKNYFLRIFIDKENGNIDIDDCERVNNAITEILDEMDYIKEQYFLEVSSPGIERIIRKDSHLQENIGNNIEVKVFKPINNMKQLLGILKSFNQEEITMQLKNEDVTIKRKDISLIKTVYDW